MFPFWCNLHATTCRIKLYSFELMLPVTASSPAQSVTQRYKVGVKRLKKPKKSFEYTSQCSLQVPFSVQKN